MTPAQTQMLLGIAASFDNRKPSEEAAVAWSHALDGYRFEDCRDAIVAHYRASSEWLMPAKVIAEVKRIRAKRIEEHPPLIPPPGLDDAAERAWLLEARRRIGSGEVIDSEAAFGELVTSAAVNFRELLPAPDDDTRPRREPLPAHDSNEESTDE